MAQHNAMTPPGEDPRRTGRGLGLATRVQVAAHSFMSRRADLGLTRRRVRMESDPGRRESMAIIGSITLTAVICLAALFWSFLRPAGSAGQASIIADQKTGALYVRVGQTLYPALNLASARLIAGQADNPVRVRRSEIDGMARGPLVGIPGAPSMLDATAPPTGVSLRYRRLFSYRRDGACGVFQNPDGNGRGPPCRHNGIGEIDLYRTLVFLDRGAAFLCMCSLVHFLMGVTANAKQCLL